MTFISRKELADYFSSRGNHFMNSQRLELRWLDPWGASTSLTVADILPDSYELSITTCEEGHDGFIEGFRIGNTQDIESLATKTFGHYLNGHVEIDITPVEFEAVFSFRI